LIEIRCPLPRHWRQWVGGLLLSGLTMAVGGVDAVPDEKESPSPSPFSWRQVENKAFGVGESIVYVIKYGLIPAGHATLEIPHIQDVGGRPAYYIISSARSNKAVDIFFKVRDKNESWVDVGSLSSKIFYQRLREGRYRVDRRTEYDHPNRRFVYTRKGKGKTSVKEGEIPAFVQDVLSSLFYLRTQDLKVGGVYTLDANSAGKTWPLEIRVKRIQKIRVPAGKFECYRVEPILAGAGVFKKEGNLEVWLTKDERKIPILLRSKIAVGAFDAEMREYHPGDVAPH